MKIYLSFLGDEMWLFLTVFPYKVSYTFLNPTKCNECGSSDLKISETRVHMLPTKKRKCK